MAEPHRCGRVGRIERQDFGDAQRLIGGVRALVAAGRIAAGDEAAHRLPGIEVGRDRAPVGGGDDSSAGGEDVAHWPDRRIALRPDHPLMRQARGIRMPERRAHVVEHVQFRQAGNVRRRDELAMGDLVLRPVRTIAAAHLLDGIEHHADGAIADGMDFHAETVAVEIGDRFGQLVERQRGRDRWFVGCAGIGGEHRGRAQRGHAVEEDLGEIGIHMRAAQLAALFAHEPGLVGRIAGAGRAQSEMEGGPAGQGAGIVEGPVEFQRLQARRRIGEAGDAEAVEIGNRGARGLGLPGRGEFRNGVRDGPGTGLDEQAGRPPRSVLDDLAIRRV